MTIDRVVGVTVQVVVPVHAPPQPTKVEPVSGVAVRVTIVPVENTPVQSVGLRLVLVLLQLPIAELGLPETVRLPLLGPGPRAARSTRRAASDRNFQ